MTFIPILCRFSIPILLVSFKVSETAIIPYRISLLEIKISVLPSLDKFSYSLLAYDISISLEFISFSFPINNCLSSIIALIPYPGIELNTKSSINSIF